MTREINDNNLKSFEKFLNKTGVPELPIDLEEKVREFTLEDSYFIQLTSLAHMANSAMTVIHRMQARCGECAKIPTPQVCPHCDEDAKTIAEAMTNSYLTARVVVEASKPGGRISAQLEARREAYAQQGKGND